MRNILGAWMLIALCCSALAGRNDVEVVATGMAAIATDRAAAVEEAVLDAKRNAVEQALGVIVNAEALAQNYEVVWDTIRTRSHGYIRRWELLGEPEWDTRNGLVKVRVRAMVSAADAVKDLWDVPEVYVALERPSIGVRLLSADTRKPEPVSTAALVHALRVRGFDVADSATGRTEVLITGTVRTEVGIRLGDPDSPYNLGTVVASQKSFAEVRVIWADTGAVIVAPFRWEARGFSFNSDDEAQREALRALGRELVDEDKGALGQKVLGAWISQLQNGLRVRVVIAGATYRLLSQFVDRLREVRGVARVERERMENGDGVVDIVMRLTPAVFRRQLMRLEVAGKRVAIVRHSPSMVRLSLR